MDAFLEKVALDSCALINFRKEHHSLIVKSISHYQYVLTTTVVEEICNIANSSIADKVEILKRDILFILDIRAERIPSSAIFSKNTSLRIGDLLTDGNIFNNTLSPSGNNSEDAIILDTVINRGLRLITGDIKLYKKAKASYPDMIIWYEDFVTELKNV